MSDRETFGPRLRSERERRGISLETIATVTKVSADLWDGLERNDFSRWPTGYLRSCLRSRLRESRRTRCRRIVDEFCRLYAIGTAARTSDQGAGSADRARRRLRRLDGPAERRPRASLPHQAGAGPGAPHPPRPARRSRPESTPASPSSPPPACRWRSIPASGPPPPRSASPITASRPSPSANPGSKAVDALRHRLPALVAVHDRRAHAA